ncbi:MAG: tetratricopeptide (TPR) repeat protein, partial [Planctomycetota bacterium]
MRKLLSVLCLLVFASSALGQERTQDPKKQLQSYERYLERKPYHDWAFEKLVAAAVSAGQLEPLVERWRARHAEDPANNGTRVVLVRLMVATDEWDEALELLQAMDAPGAEAHRLEGQLQERRGESDSAAAAFGRAVEATEDPALLESLYGEQAAALLGSGEREAAVAAFRALAQLRPDSFHLRVEAASLLADNGLLEEAAEVLVEAKRLADDDAEKRSRVLSELAKVHERRGDAEQATACYFEAFGLLARGHWLRRELTPRLISLAQRTGGLPALIERCQSDAERRSDLSAREMLAQVLSIAGRQEEARAVLEAAVLDFPADLALSRSLLHMLKLAEDHEARVLEYQRILAAHPRELELYLALGQAFADGGQLDAARREWQRSLERRVDDPSLCTRLAGFFASHEQVDDAIGMYERAIALEPRNLARYGDLALYLTGLERVEEATAALERAVTSAAGDARRLEELSSMWIAQGEPKRAQEALEAALVLEPEAASMMSRLAEIYRRDGEHERAGELLRRVVNVARESSLRKAAVDRLVRSADELGQLQALVDQSQAAIEAGQAGVGDYLLVAKGAERLRRPALAEATLLSLLEQHPDLEEAHLWMARLLRQDGALEEALARYKLLLEIRPQSRRRVLKDMASVHLALYQSAEAFACYEEMLRASPDNPAAWLEVADAYEKLSLSDEALRCVRQAVRLEPESGTTRLRLANTLKQNGEWQRAEAEILTVASQGDPESASLARSKHYSMLREVGEVRRRMEELRVRVLDNPYDVLASLTLSDLYSRESEYALALETVDRLLSYQPREPRLMGERARLLESMERWGEALVVRKELRALPTADPTETSFELARVALELGDMEQARQVLAGVRDARRKAALFRKYKFSELAKTVLREGLGGGQGDASLLLFLARILEADEDYEGAAEALEQVRALRGESWRLAMDIGRLCHLNKDQAGALAAGRQLFELYRTPLEELEKKATSQRLSSGSRSYQSIERWFKLQDLE